MTQDTLQQIQDFKLRMETELDFCYELFNYATLRLMAAKYAYYELSNPYLDDLAYDILEKSWHIMGLALGLLTEDMSAPCIDWDKNHPMASEAIILANKLIKR